MPRSAAGAERWFAIKTQIHTRLLNSLSPEQLRGLNKDGVREQIGTGLERLVREENIPMMSPNASGSSKKFSTKYLGLVLWSR